MSGKLSLRLRVTLVCGLLLTACCVLLTLSNSYSAYEMADALEAVPLQPSYTAAEQEAVAVEKAALVEISMPARRTFRVQSLAAMCVVVAGGCLLVYYLTGKALAPLRQLDEQIRRRTAADLDQPLPVPDSGDEVAGLTVSFNQMSQNLSRAFAQQKRFSQCAAHELRTPLAILKTRMALFRKKGLCDRPETAALLEVLEAQTDRLSQVVWDLLALTNLDGVDCSEQVSLPEVLQAVTEDLAGLARERGITLRMRAEAGTVIGSETLLERALFNLVENAVRYNRPQGTVDICAVKRGNGAEVSVADEGGGIPPELREEIFEPFFRIDKSRSRQQGGAGLGLALVRVIAELHHGAVWVEDAPARGSRFVMTLPGPEEENKTRNVRE